MSITHRFVCVIAHGLIEASKFEHAINKFFTTIYPANEHYHVLHNCYICIYANIKQAVTGG